MLHDSSHHRHLSWDFEGPWLFWLIVTAVAIAVVLLWCVEPAH